MRNRGKPIAFPIIEKAKRLLATTDLPMPLIAERLGVSRNVVWKVNNENHIRTYSTHNHWRVA